MNLVSTKADELGEWPISDLSCGVYRVPTDRPEADGTLAWSETTVVVVEVHAGGRVGTGWTYAARAAQAIIEDVARGVLVGSRGFDVAALHERVVRQCRNFGRPGVVACALSALDIALWDLKARLLEVPLAHLFGRCVEEVPVYGSGGFTTYDEETATAQLEHWTVELGIPRVKIKIGESFGGNVGRDLARVGHARSVIGEDAELYVDANGGYRVKQAVRVGRHLVDEHAVSWFEEPVSSDDLAGLREVRDQLSCDVAAGEYGYDEGYFARMVEAGSVDCLQIDVTRCGGYTSFLRAAAIAAANGLQVSGHCAPSLHAPVALAVPNLRHVEYFHDHERVDALLFEGALVPRHGVLVPALDRPGHGMALKDDVSFRVA